MDPQYDDEYTLTVKRGPRLPLHHVHHSSMPWRAVAVCGLLVVFVASTAEGISVPHCWFVKASATSPKVRDINAYPGQAQGHWVCAPNTSEPSRGLFLFMPGTSPNVYQQVVETAASAGFHAIGVQWDDRPCVACICAGRCDDFNRTQRISDCSHDAILMRMFGEGFAPANGVGYRVDQPNSVHGRIVSLLGYLDTNASFGPGWPRYLTPNRSAVLWDQVTLGGHSRASDYPLAISKIFRLRRALLFGGPGQEFLGVCSAAPPSRTNCNPAAGFGENGWLTALPGKVPASALYGLMAGYVGDACNMAIPVWKMMELPGAAILNNATAAGPAAEINTRLGGARRLFDIEVCLHAASPHMCMISEIDAPLDSDGRHKLAPVWRYMMTNERAATRPAVAKERAVNCTMVPRPPGLSRVPELLNL